MKFEATPEQSDFCQMVVINTIGYNEEKVIDPFFTESFEINFEMSKQCVYTRCRKLIPCTFNGDLQSKPLENLVKCEQILTKTTL